MKGKAAVHQWIIATADTRTMGETTDLLNLYDEGAKDERDAIVAIIRDEMGAYGCDPAIDQMIARIEDR